MTLLVDTIISKNKTGTTIEFSSATTYLNGTKKLNLDQGLIKGYCTEFDQASNATERTFNLSSVADVSTGVVDYFHANPMRAKRAYICMPNDARYGVIGVESQDILTTECHTNEWNSDGSSNSLDDGNHQCTFFGELS